MPKIYVIRIRREFDGATRYYRSSAIAYFNAVADVKDAKHFKRQIAAENVRHALVELGLTSYNVSVINIDRAEARKAW